MKTFLPLILSLLFEFQAFADDQAAKVVTDAPSGQYSLIQTQPDPLLKS